tara:strand:+ start:122 stop:379 length:258 start_codon:yes stop_codon:yes gene_type:complete
MCKWGGVLGLKELLRTNDLVLISWIRSVLNEAEIELFVLDAAMSVLEGSANAIPRRIMVAEEDHVNALRILKQAQSEVEGMAIFT